KRYEVANYKNAFIPTNLDVDDAVRKEFGPFYAALFDATVEKHPGAVVTEYSWDAQSCDPCPTPALSPGDILTLGADALAPAEKARSATRMRSSRSTSTCARRKKAKPVGTSRASTPGASP